MALLLTTYTVHVIVVFTNTVYVFEEVRDAAQ